MKQGSEIIKLIKEGSPIAAVLQHPLVRDNVEKMAGIQYLYTIDWPHIQNRHFFDSFDILKKFLIPGKPFCIRNAQTGILAATIVDEQTNPVGEVICAMPASLNTFGAITQKL